jgi:hypothetical protein
MFVSSKRILDKPIRVGMEATASIHQNVSVGYYAVSPTGERTFVPYTPQEKTGIHFFISPGIKRKNHVKWKKTKGWKDRAKAKASQWHYHPTFGGLNTVSK